VFEFSLEATEGAARSGTLTLPHGVVQTPCFMPVGTHGTVRGLHPDEVRRTGAQIILGNTYHLHLRPGEDVIATMGGLNRFSGWPLPMLTDSGGFQVFSLAGMRKLDEEGVEFRSHIDGSTRHLTPERSMEIQWDLGADIAMAFDHLPPGDATRDVGSSARGTDTPRSRPRPRRARRSGRSSRADRMPISGAPRSTAFSIGATGPGWPSAASRWASRSR
jgi:queuine tRNA-ribosyltransferase